MKADCLYVCRMNAATARRERRVQVKTRSGLGFGTTTVAA